MKVTGQSTEILVTGLLSLYLYPLNHHELLHQRLHLACEVHRSLQHDEGVDRGEGGLERRLAPDTQHLGDTEATQETFQYEPRLNTKSEDSSSHLFTSITHSSSLFFSV